MKRIMAVLLLTVVGSGPVLAAERVCLQPARIRGYDVLDERTLVIRESSTRKYKVTLVGRCHGVKQAMRLGVRPRASSLACLRMGDRLDYRDGFGWLETCVIKSVERYAPAEADGSSS